MQKPNGNKIEDKNTINLVNDENEEMLKLIV